MASGAAARSALSALSVVAALAGCGAAPPPGPDPGAPPPFEVTVGVDAATKYQVMQGFGAAVAFEITFLTQHPNRDEIYQVVFADLGLQVLRVANWYQNSQAGASATGDFNETVALVTAARTSLGHDPVIVMSSWSPPAIMKSNNNVIAGTLARTAAGDFRYADFGAWWRSALDAHAAAGVFPNFISIQNEPDFVPTGSNTWASCLLDATEGATNAGYGPALDAVASAIADLSPRPVLIGPEVSGISGNRVQSYLSAMTSEGLVDRLGGVAHHLYNGGSAAMPNTFNAGINALAAVAGGKPLFQTEFGPSPVDMFNVAWLIQNAVTVESAASYLHWDLIWGDSIASASPQGLVTTENPFSPANWKTPKGYRINDAYYAVRHFSKWIDTGWQRVATSATASVIRASAFTSPDGLSLTVVLLNTDSEPHAVTVDRGGFAAASSAVYRTSGTDERTTPLGPLPDGNVVDMPGRSLVTVTFSN
jgi:glucuronoarabinoxylan endo-1,4-beta-xylanase